MSFIQHIPITFFLLLIPLHFTLSHAARFDVRNNCPYIVWAAAIPGGGRQLNRRRKCQTGDCGGLLQCKAYGSPPNTLAEYALNQFGNMDFSTFHCPTSNGCTRGIKCAQDINTQCPNELRAPGGCHNPCTVFKMDQDCCNSGRCGPTNLSKFFKDRCRDAYSYPKDDPTSTFTCPSGTNYKVVFCP
ncbi:unnamed protein product [Malus baccata var. baccata]